jgi:hypothetical protein
MAFLEKIERLAHRIAHKIGAARQRGCRLEVERLLFELAWVGTERFAGTTLVDATFDSPNYWFRYSILRAAMGLAHGVEVGVLGHFRNKSIRGTASRLGIRRLAYFPGKGEITRHHQEISASLVESLRCPDDLLNWNLPYGMPAWDLYDALLKRQRRACLDINDPLLVGRVAEYLRDLDAAEDLVAEHQPSFAVMSHTVSGRTNHGPLMWQLTRRKIPVVVPQGGFGNLTHFKIFNFDEVFNHSNRPTLEDINGLQPEKAAKLQDIGRRYLAARLGGETTDLSAIHAFQQGKLSISLETLCAKFDWDSAKPVIAVFASVWFDNPHTFGMTAFRDFHDWLESTINVACKFNGVNWLFKPHPAENWYGGVKLKDMLPALLPSHVRIADEEWSGTSLRDCLQGIVTLHGTAGIEMAAMGKPVLVASQGWYGDVGFVVWPRTRQAYLETLATRWWEGLDLEKASCLAQIFAGFYFCKPAGGTGISLRDDSEQHKLFPRLRTLLVEEQQNVVNEVNTMASWMKSDSRHYHMFKMKLADSYEISGLDN